MSPLMFTLSVTAVFALTASGVVLANGGSRYIPRHLYDPACNIKGNISVENGEKIFHIPGQEFYDETSIRPWRGERWFCSEADAYSAGWRMALR